MKRCKQASSHSDGHRDFLKEFVGVTKCSEGHKESEEDSRFLHAYSLHSLIYYHVYHQNCRANYILYQASRGFSSFLAWPNTKTKHIKERNCS